jgi:hypothetical protein
MGGINCYLNKGWAVPDRAGLMPDRAQFAADPEIALQAVSNRDLNS